MIDPIGVYRQNKKAQHKQKIRDAWQVFAGIVIFYAIVAIAGLMPII